MIIIKSNSNDPSYNLALEEYIFEYMSQDEDYFWLWQNQDAVIIGKHQNTAQEINKAYTENNNIKVVRRLSGGGAVFHDMGNVNFTFITNVGDLQKINMKMFCMPVIKTLKGIGVEAELNGRNDMTIDGKKFSGNAQYIKKGRIMHHGCIMFDSNVSILEKALNVPKDKYESKGFKSVKSRVTNIKPHLPADLFDLSSEEFKILLENQIKFLHGDTQIYNLNKDDEKIVERIKKERYDTWEWNYGRSPMFSVSKRRKVEDVGTIEMHLNVEDGIISDYMSYGDYFGEGSNESLKELLIGCKLKKDSLMEALQGFSIELCYNNLKKEAFVDLLLS